MYTTTAKLILAFSVFLVISTSCAHAQLANLINAGGNVTNVSGTVFELGSATTASDGTSTVAGNNGQMYTNDPGAFGGSYFAEAGPIILDMDLGALNSFDGVAFWNRSLFNGNSVRNFSVTFSGDSTFGNGDDSSTFSFEAAVGVNQDQQDFLLGTVVSGAQFVRVEITSNWIDDPGTAGGDRTNFSEFQFNVVPEASTQVLVAVVGMIFLMFRLHRRQGRTE